MRALSGVLLWLIAGAGFAAPEMPPQLAPANQLEFRDYLDAPDHRAFAIAPGGAWGWSAGEASAEVAEEKALADCARNTEQRCLPYAVDGRRVFDDKAWIRLWGPYASAKEAASRRVGTQRGERFPDVLLRDARGRPISPAMLAGKVVFLHFWATWCPPCRRELPELKKLQTALADRRDVAFVLVQVREPYATAQEWLRQQGLTLPLYDSGAGGDGDTEFRLSDGGRMGDRKIATRFPTSYVLDKRGLVVFSHVGPVADWLAYRAFVLDVAERSGR